MLVDTPPALVVSDVTPLLRQVDGVLVVASLGLTTPDATVQLRNQLRAAYAGVIGVVLYEDVSTGTGTGGYRIALVQQISENWSLLGAGVSARTLRLGVNEDLGLSNTFVVVGFVGGALQLAAAARLRAGASCPQSRGCHDRARFPNAVGDACEPALMEIGHSRVTYGTAVGFAAWLGIPNPRRPPAPRPTRREPEVAAG